MSLFKHWVPVWKLIEPFNLQCQNCMYLISQFIRYDKRLLKILNHRKLVYSLGWLLQWLTALLSVRKR